MDGPQFWLPMAVTATRFAKARDDDDYLKRLAAMPTTVAQLQQQLEKSIKSGWMPPRITLRNVPVQFAALAAGNAGTNPLFAPFKAFPGDIGEADQQRLRQTGEKVIRAMVAPDSSPFLNRQYVLTIAAVQNHSY
jgi:uncharacterized protein (DUF885 family)